MAKNPEPEKPVESNSETTDDEASSEDGSSESDSEPEQTPTTKTPSSLPLAALKKPQPPSSKTQPPPPPPSASPDDEESGSESESESKSESDSDVPDPNVRPVASKPTDDPQKSNTGSRKPAPKPSSASETKSVGAKRTSDEKESEAKDAKRSKKKPEPEAESSEKKVKDDPKKQHFQRIWSEDDEIVILKGMIDYVKNIKSDPVADLDAFHILIKDNLTADVKRTQLQDKIRRLKRKYETNKRKEREGEDMTFLKPHELKAYELSKHVWGKEKGKENGAEKSVGSPNMSGSVVKKSRRKKGNADENGESGDVKNVEVVKGGDWDMQLAKKESSNDVIMEERILRIGAKMFEGVKGLDGERKWQKLKLEEMEIYLRKLDLMRAQTKLVLDVLKSDYH